MAELIIFKKDGRIKKMIRYSISHELGKIPSGDYCNSCPCFDWLERRLPCCKLFFGEILEIEQFRIDEEIGEILVCRKGWQCRQMKPEIIFKNP